MDYVSLDPDIQTIAIAKRNKHNEVENFKITSKLVKTEYKHSEQATHEH